MDTKEIFAALKQLHKEKGIPMDALCAKVQDALVKSIKTEYKGRDMVFCEIDPKEETVRVFIRKRVVDEIMDPVEEMLVDEAKKYKPTAVEGDIIEIDLDTDDFSRIEAEKGKHVIRQGIKEEERDRMREEMQSKNQEVVTARVSKVDPESGDAIVEIGTATEILFKSEQIPGEVIRAGDLIKVFVSESRNALRKTTRIELSRKNEGFVKRLLELEVPEIYDGTVEVKAVAREAGSRTKVAVYSSDENVDAVGACIGPGKARISKVVSQLNGEKIDIVKYSSDLAEFVAAAIAPAEVISAEIVETGDNKKKCSVVVPDMKLSLAIGTRGQNARLAARLTSCTIDIKPESGTETPAIVL